LTVERSLGWLLAVVALLALTAGCDVSDDNTYRTPTYQPPDDDASPDDDSPDDDESPDDDDDQPPPDPFLHPEAPGPFLVGNASFFFTDESRPLGCGPGRRVLLTEVWYPAVDNADDWPENYIEDFFLGRMDEVEAALEAAGLDPGEELADLPTGSYRGAPLHPDAPPMPVLVFSHGFSSNRFQNYTMAGYLASHGYLVVAPDHICNSVVTLTPDEAVVIHPLSTPFSLAQRKGDMQFLMDVFADDPPEMFAGRLAANQIGIWGHSFGGITVAETIKIDARPGAVLQLAAFAFPFLPVPDDETAPSMYYWGKQDKWMHPFRAWHDKFVDEMPPPKYQLEFFDTGHFAFSDLCLYVPQLAAHGNGCIAEKKIGSDELFTNPDHDALHGVLDPYAVAFFGSALLGYDELAEFLAVNHNPDMMEYQTTAR
jgi:pimeloyl-ACP methyl ester carboxylesterase